MLVDLEPIDLTALKSSVEASNILANDNTILFSKAAPNEPLSLFLEYSFAALFNPPAIIPPTNSVPIRSNNN